MSLNRTELQDAARKAFGENGLAPDAATSWRNLTDLGWFMLTVPEHQGGLGMGPEALAIIHYELGRAIVPGPAIAHMLGVSAFAKTGRSDLLSRALAGELTSCNLCGALEADTASQLLFVSDDQISICPSPISTQVSIWDETRRLFDVRLGDSVDILASGADAKAIGESLRSELLLMIAADSLGGADAILNMTIDYLKTRRQFDRPLALFQALKHRVADLKIALSAAEALLWSRADGTATLAEMGALKALATSTYKTIAEEAIQLHGGIGLTQEYPCHLFLKRAFLNSALGGDADHWEERAGRDALTKFTSH